MWRKLYELQEERRHVPRVRLRSDARGRRGHGAANVPVLQTGYRTGTGLFRAGERSGPNIHGFKPEDCEGRMTKIIFHDGSTGETPLTFQQLRWLYDQAKAGWINASLNVDYEGVATRVNVLDIKPVEPKVEVLDEVFDRR